MCARGRRPAREPSAPRASLGASSRSPARPRRRPRAPQPGPATAHGRRSQALRSLRRPPHQWGRVAVNSTARLRHRPPAPRPGPAFCSSPVPSGPSGALHTGGAWCAGVWLGALSRCPARSRRRPWAPQPGPAFCSSPVPSGPSGALRTGGARSLLSGSARVVTNVVNPSCILCGFSCACYKRRQSDGIFAKNSGFWPQIDDVCNTGPHRGLQNAPV